MKKRRILVVDDDSAFTRILKLTLEETNDYEVHTENAAGTACAAARQFRPDLVFLDVMMPEMDGGDLASRFQADPQLAQVPLVFLTAAVRKKEVYDRGGTIGGLPFLAKPVDLPEVIDCINRHLAR
jgi:two-component system, OmpR family, response regulator